MSALRQLLPVQYVPGRTATMPGTNANGRRRPAVLPRVSNSVRIDADRFVPSHKIKPCWKLLFCAGL